MPVLQVLPDSSRQLSLGDTPDKPETSQPNGENDWNSHNSNPYLDRLGRFSREVLTDAKFNHVGLFSGGGWEKDPHSNRIVVLAATDNLMKGAAGQAVQALNIRLGFPEETAIDFPGLHPI